MKRRNGDWTIKKTREIFENDYFKVSEDDVIKPDGTDGKYATIGFKPGSSVLPLDKDGFVYLTKQFRYALEREDLEVVSGAAEEENFLETAKREAFEELGIEAEDWTELGKIEDNTSITDSKTFLFLARKLKFGKPHPEASEKIESVKMKLEDAVEKVLKGEITHSQTCVLILKVYFFIEKEKSKR